MCSPEEAEPASYEIAKWLKKNSKRYAIRRSDDTNPRPLWSILSWDKVLRREGRKTWKYIGSSLTDTLSTPPRIRIRRSHSEPIIIPRRKPIISDEVLIQFGEQAAAIAAQLKHYKSDRGIWTYKHPHTDYLYAIFRELVEMREQVRVKLVHRKQYVEKLMGSPKVAGSADRFYTRFQWIKSYATQPTSQLIVYFHYGNMVQYSVARMTHPLTSADIQILRGQLLAHSEAKRSLAVNARTQTLCDLWSKMHRQLP